MKKHALAVAFAALSTAPALAAPVNWIDWQSWNGSTEVYGVLTTGASTVNVTFSSTANLSPAPILDTVGADYWTYGTRDPATSPFTNVGPTYAVDNIPDEKDIIRMASAATYTLTFDQAVSDIYLAFVSFNNNTMVFDTEAILLSAAGMNIDGNGTDARGYWGQTSNASISTTGSTWSLSGSSEPHGTLVLPGTFTSLQFSAGGENWYGMTFGVSEVPLPLPGLMLIGGLGALAAFRRRSV